MRPLSLRSRLLLLIIGVLAAVLLPLGILSAQRTLEEVDELSDARLAQAARTLEVLVNRIGVGQLREQRMARLLVPSATNHPAELTVHGRTYESEVGFQVIDRDGTLLMATENLAAVPRTRVPDGQYEDVMQGRYTWRVFTLIMETQGITIRAGERYDSRHEITHALWLEHGLPTLLGLPLLAVLVGWAIRRGLGPLDDLAVALGRREPGSRAPVHLRGDTPDELKPVMVALNDQILRLESALERERRFSADVAHELRTPLASTMINLESALASARPDEAQAALNAARDCLVSLARRAEQILALARLEAGAAAGPRANVDLASLALDVVDELAPVIARGNVELEIDRPDSDVVIEGYPVALGVLLRNLLDNAFRHVPSGGHIALLIARRDSHAVIEVVDDGPGIPPERRAGMFGRFQRGVDSHGEGYGLGLSIVQRAAELHGASVELLDRADGRGLRVVVTLPCQG